MRIALIACLFLPLVGCTSTDPLQRPGLWHPNGANDANLRAMIADPQDLVVGVSAPAADGQVVAAAIQRYRSGKVKPLPDSNVSQVGVTGNGGVAPPAAGDAN